MIHRRFTPVAGAAFLIVTIFTSVAAHAQLTVFDPSSFFAEPANCRAGIAAGQQ